MSDIVHVAHVVPRPTVMLCSCGVEVDVCSPCGRIRHVTDLEPGSSERSRSCLKRDARGFCANGGLVVQSRSATAELREANKRAKRRGTP